MMGGAQIRPSRLSCDLGESYGVVSRRTSGSCSGQELTNRRYKEKTLFYTPIETTYFCMLATSHYTKPPCDVRPPRFTNMWLCSSNSYHNLWNVLVKRYKYSTAQQQLHRELPHPLSVHLLILTVIDISPFSTSQSPVLVFSFLLSFQALQNGWAICRLLRERERGEVCGRQELFPGLPEVPDKGRYKRLTAIGALYQQVSSSVFSIWTWYSITIEEKDHATWAQYCLLHVLQFVSLS